MRGLDDIRRHDPRRRAARSAALAASGWIRFPPPGRRLAGPRPRRRCAGLPGDRRRGARLPELVGTVESRRHGAEHANEPEAIAEALARAERELAGEGQRRAPTR